MLLLALLLVLLSALRLVLLPALRALKPIAPQAPIAQLPVLLSSLRLVLLPALLPAAAGALLQGEKPLALWPEEAPLLVLQPTKPVALLLGPRLGLRLSGTLAALQAPKPVASLLLLPALWLMPLPALQAPEPPLLVLRPLLETWAPHQYGSSLLPLLPALRPAEALLLVLLTLLLVLPPGLALL